MIAAKMRGPVRLAPSRYLLHLGGAELHLPKAMSDVHSQVEQYPGDEALYCHIGKHTYTNDTCTWCGRRDHTTQAITPNT